MNIIRKRRVSGVCAASALAIAVALSGARAQEAIRTFDIESQPLASALLEFSNETDIVVVAPSKLVNGKTAPAVSGDMAPAEALEALLAGSELKYTRGAQGDIRIIEAGLDRAQRAARAPRPVRVAQAGEGAALRAAAADDDVSEDSERDEIVVTGTNIRGIAPESSPVRSFTREDIQITGAATAQDFILTLPQNFGGGNNERTAGGLPNNFDAANNFGRGSSVNLRGLGSGSTLVLINGRRIAPSSGLGDFVDISLIPASAIERVDVLTDGASSIYGADAVAGVVNFVLRDDYDGAEASVRYGSVTQGNLDEFRAGLTGGKSWDTGNALVAYEFYSRTNLSAGDRDFSSASPLPTDLSPSQRRYSILVSASQDVTPRLEVSADFGVSRRDIEAEFTPLAVNQFNLTDSRTDTLNASAGASWEATDAWRVDLSGAYSRVDLEQQPFGIGLGSVIDSEILTSDLIASGDVFSLPGGVVKLALGGHFRTEDFIVARIESGAVAGEADRDVYALYGEAFIPIIGPDNALPGVERLEINVSGRYSDFSDFGDTANPKVGVLWSPIEDLRLRGSYSTSFNPPALGRAGAIDRGALVYPTTFINAILGVAPGDPSIADVVGLNVGGTSRSLGPETSRAFTGGFDLDKAWGAHTVSLSSTYFDIRFEGRIGRTPVPGSGSTINAPNIAINTPEAFPEGTVIFNPTAEQIAEAIASLDGPVLQGSPSETVDPFDAAFINFASVNRNLAFSFVRGLDFYVAYTFNAETGVYSLGLDGTYLDDFQQQAAVTSAVVENLNTQFNPVDLRLRLRAGYAHKGFSATVFVNYTDDYRVDNTPGAAPIDSWTTADLTLVYDTQERFGKSVLNDTQFRLSVINLFDENPPLTPDAPNFGLFGYDPTNASPLNRFVSFEIAKRF